MTTGMSARDAYGEPARGTISRAVWSELGRPEQISYTTESSGYADEPTRPLSRGQRFRHMHQITQDSSPRQGRIEYVICVITGTRLGSVYYTTAEAWDRGSRKGAYYETVSKFLTDVVREWID